MHMIKNSILNPKTINAKVGITFYELMLENFTKEEVKKIAVCKFNGKYRELCETIEEQGNVEVIPFCSEAGIKVYSKTLQMIFITAVLELFDDANITIEHSISKAVYGEVHKKEPLTEADIEKIKIKMKDLIKEDILIEKIKILREDAINIFLSYGMDDKVKLIANTNLQKINLYKIKNRYDYSHESLAYSTGFIDNFDIRKYEDGFIIIRPNKDNMSELREFKENKNLYNVFKETEEWLRVLDIGEIGTLNEKISGSQLQNVILVSEALHEKRISNIADEISKKSGVKIILIAGPSSSGKTTFANRLSIQLRVNGIVPVPLSLDDYFVNREDTPLDENGQYDFESIDALDIDLLNDNLERLMRGEEVNIPTFNFKTGIKEWLGIKVTLPQNGVIILEGIHGLNPKLISDDLENNLFKIYISALTQLNIDNHNRISTTDVRRIRRIVRDSLSRGYSAEDTLKMWPSIKRGEKKNIFVYQERADAVFNSTLVYELGLLKPYALKELEKVEKDSPVYAEALRLIKLLKLFQNVDINEVPRNSLLREFIGGSCFYEY